MVIRRGSARTRAAAPFLVAALGVGLVACSSGASLAPAATPSANPTSASTEVPSAAPSPPASPPAATASPAPSAVSVAPACTSSSLKASHDLVEGAAGSRLTTVVLTASEACSVDASPAMGIRDANGTELVSAASAGPGRIDLDPNLTYSSAVQFANWCNPDPSFPLALVIRIGTGEVGVSGASFPDEGDMPPCNGGGGPVLEAAAWAATP